MNQRILKGAVLGNGPSRDQYDFTADVVIGCNIPGEGYSVDATVIADTEVIWLLKNNPELVSCPLILSTYAYEKMKELKIVDLFEVHDVFTSRDWHTSGHYALRYLTLIIECAKVDIWGCDSYFVDDRTSLTDKLVNNSGDSFFKQWRSTWNQIFEENPDVYFTMKR